VATALSARKVRRRSLSQNFLRSKRLAAELVGEAGVEPSDLVVDIGAGSGRLTVELAERAGRVHAIELDPAWAAHLRHRLASYPNVVVIEGDVLRQPLPDEPFKVVANLPFHLTGAIVGHLLDDPRTALRRADLIVQWGVAKKRTAPPSTLRNVYWGAWYEFTLARRLPAACFVPKPNVDAAVLRIERRRVPLVPEADRRAFKRLLQMGFAGPPLRRALRSKLSPSQLDCAARLFGFARQARAGDLDARQWAQLFHLLRDRRRVAR
jgi:23S rRNA (adenine-N6)-dimethyltransferase